MKRKHAFVLVVLLAGAFIAGLLALTRTNDLSASMKTSPAVSEAAIRARMKALDRFEASLHKQLREKGLRVPRVRAGRAVATAPAPAVAATPAVTYVHASAPGSSQTSYDDYGDDLDDHEFESEDETEHEDD